MAVESQIVKAFPDGRMDTRNAALYLGLSPKTLAMKRCTGAGPLFVKRGRIYYFKSDLDAWLNGQGRLASTAQSKPQQPTH
ncbi:MAG: helix-turn-helix domain-containing protein [Nevskia sp.]|nr:helix-turn-helix domain-containing protein [Nevskia sp.]